MQNSYHWENWLNWWALKGQLTIDAKMEIHSRLVLMEMSQHPSAGSDCGNRLSLLRQNGISDYARREEKYFAFRDCRLEKSWVVFGVCGVCLISISSCYSSLRGHMRLRRRRRYVKTEEYERDQVGEWRGPVVTIKVETLQAIVQLSTRLRKIQFSMNWRYSWWIFHYRSSPGSEVRTMGMNSVLLRLRPNVLVIST